VARRSRGEASVPAKEALRSVAKRAARRKVVRRPEDIPEFASEEEEHRFWSEHRLGGKMLKEMKPPPEGLLPPPREETRPVSVRFDPDMLDRLRALAARRGQRYQTLLKQFVVERLYEEEQREGIVKPRRDPRRS
jgi:hypothetical protein